MQPRQFAPHDDLVAQDVKSSHDRTQQYRDEQSDHAEEHAHLPETGVANHLLKEDLKEGLL